MNGMIFFALELLSAILILDWLGQLWDGDE